MQPVDDRRYSPLFVKFIHHFNGDRDYYECHEVLEELWMEEGRICSIRGCCRWRWGCIIIETADAVRAEETVSGGPG